MLSKPEIAAALFLAVSIILEEVRLYAAERESVRALTESVPGLVRSIAPEKN